MAERRCPECKGVGWMTYGSHSTDSEPCRRCAGRGQVDWCPRCGWLDPSPADRLTPALLHDGGGTEGATESTDGWTCACGRSERHLPTIECEAIPPTPAASDGGPDA